MAHADEVRRLLVNEPRGHADMYGCHVVPPDDDGAAFGAVFFHKDGYSLACGHGTIALGAWAVRSGRIAAPDTGETDVVIDVPSGRVVARVRTVAGRVVAVVFRNVPAYVTARNVPVDTDVGPVSADLSWGGAMYASVRADAVGVTVHPDHLPRLTDVGRRIKWALDDHPAVRHPVDERLSGLYGTILWEPVSDDHRHQRNVTVFADGEVDRSPCGSGTSARLALLDDEGALGDGGTLTHDSIVGSRFLGRVVERVTEHGRAAVVTEVEGIAHPTGRHEFTLEEDDELGTGFQLR
jgi:proline racemase